MWRCLESTFLFLLVGLPTLSCAVSVPAEVFVPKAQSPLQRQELLQSEDGVLTAVLTLDAVHLVGPDISLFTRAFNGSVPGPGVAVRPGDRLRIKYVNRLGTPVGPNLYNKYHHPNTTNLHVHGLHVSSLPPGDDVLGVALMPGEEHQYEYHILPDHSPGTYWLHPHHHGAAVLQTSAGAAAPLLVLDPLGYLSPQLESLEDIVIMLQALPRPKLQKAAAVSQDRLFRVERWNYGDELWLVNGAPEPVLRVQSQKWHRLRLVAAGDSTWLHMDFGSCEVALLAKDGVYISDFPRFVNKVSLSSGNRADLVVRCPAGPGGQAMRHRVAGNPPPAAGGSKTFVGTVFYLEASGPNPGGLAAEPLHPWAPSARPSYLQDLRSETADCSCATSMGLGGNTRWMAGHLWEGREHYLHRSPEDAIVERRLTGLAKHPYHAHTYPFQLMATPGGADSFFMAGDWHDTYANVVDPQAIVRFRTADFSGPQVVHCHILDHSDMGMIAVEMVQGFGAGACGCNLLDMEERMPSASDLGTSTGTAGTTLVVLTAALFAAMVVLVAVGGAYLQRSWRIAAMESYYEAFPNEPVARSACAS